MLFGRIWPVTARPSLTTLEAAVLSLSEERIRNWAQTMAGSDSASIEEELELFADDYAHLASAYEGIYESWASKAGFSARKSAQKEIDAAIEQMNHRMRQIGQSYKQYMTIAAQNTIDSQQTRMRLVLNLAAITIYTAIVISIFLLRNMKRDLAQIVEETNFVAKGGLTRPIQVSEHKNEIGDVNRSINTMQNKLQSMFSHIHELSSELGNSTGLLEVDGQNRRDGAEKQKEKIEAVLSTFNDVEQVSQQVGHNALRAIDQSDSAAQLVERSEHIISATAAVIETLAVKIQDAVNIISNLNAQTENIQDILGVIKSIADQTNLSVLKAAEAAEVITTIGTTVSEIRSMSSETRLSAQDQVNSLKSLAEIINDIAEVANDNAFQANDSTNITDTISVLSRNLLESLSEFRINRR